MEIEVISAILGSAVVSTFISSLFSHFTNRKNNALQHITEERKVWREKIRKISEDIEKVKFGNKKINQLLVQLEVNINSFGKVLEDDYEKDSHIWKEIDELKRIDNEKEFNIHKELLIYYLSLMLKEDWERSKQEVKGYSKTLIEIIVIPVINCIMGVFYSYKLKMGIEGYINILMYTILFTLIDYSAFRYCLGMGVWKMVDKNRIKKSYSYKLVLSYIGFIIIVFLTIAILYTVLDTNCPKLVILNTISCIICIWEFVYVYLNWIDYIWKKARLVRTVVNIKQRTLIENKLIRYDEEVNKVYYYIINNKQNPEKIQSAVIVWGKLISEYKMDLRDKKRMLKKEKDSKEKVHQYNQIQNKINEINELADKVNEFYKKGIINRTIRWIKTLADVKTIRNRMKKLKIFLWNDPDKI